MFNKLRARMTGEARYWYKLWSTWMAVIWGVVVTAFWTEPGTVGQIIAMMPAEDRKILSPLVMGIVVGLPVIVRLLRQSISENDHGG